MKNDAVMEGVKISVPPTLLVSAIGQIDDVRRAITLEPIAVGDSVFLLGATRDETGAGAYLRWLGERDGRPIVPGEPRPYVGNKIPRVDVDETLPLYRQLSTALDNGWVRSATTPAMGGWALAFARTVMAGEIGLDLQLECCDDLAALGPDVALFSESAGRFLITVAAEDTERIERHFDGHACRKVGQTTDRTRLRVRSGERSWLDLDVSSLKSAFKEPLADE